MSIFAPLRHPRLLALTAAIAAATMGAAGVGGASAPGAGAAAETAPIVCEIAVTEARGGVTFEARVASDTPVAGTYQLAIARAGASGSAMINQSGSFRTTTANRPVVLGEATLGGSASTYDAALELRANGDRLRCGQVVHPR